MSPVLQGALIWLTEGERESILEAAADSCEEAIAALGGEPALGLIAFDCIARRGVLGDDGIRDEVGRLAAHAGAVPMAGFYTHGEIARVRGINGFHNQTMVVLAMS